MGIATNPAVQRISKLLTDAFLEHGEKIRTELLEAYRGGALARHEAFLAASAKGLKGGISGMAGRPYDGWYHHTSFDRDAAYREWKAAHPSPTDADYRTMPPHNISDWEDVRRFAHHFSVDYREANSDANHAYEDARDGFIVKNTQKIANVLGTRTDFVDAEVRFRWSRGVFAGHVSVTLSDARFAADVGLKYVVRHIPRTTPYFQYPLLFTSAVVKGASYHAPSEDELRVLLGGKSAKVLESEKAAQEAAQGFCPMSGKHVPQEVMAPIARMASPYVKCPSCGAVVSAQNWKYRKHKTPAFERAGAAKKLESAGYCPASNERVPYETIAPFIITTTIYHPERTVYDYSNHDPVTLKDRKLPCYACGQQVRVDRRGWAATPQEVKVTYLKHKKPT